MGKRYAHAYQSFGQIAHCSVEEAVKEHRRAVLLMSFSRRRNSASLSLSALLAGLIGRRPNGAIATILGMTSLVKHAAFEVAAFIENPLRSWRQCS